MIIRTFLMLKNNCCKSCSSNIDDSYALSDVLNGNGVTKEKVYKSLAYMLNQRTTSSETSLGDTKSSSFDE